MGVIPPALEAGVFAGSPAWAAEIRPSPILHDATGEGEVLLPLTAVMETPPRPAQAPRAGPRS